MAFDLVQILNNSLSVAVNNAVALKGKTSQTVNLHNATNTVTDGETIDVSDYSTLFLLASGYYYCFEVKASTDNTTWVNLPIYRQGTMTFSDEARVNATYIVDVTGYKYVKCPTLHNCMNLTLNGYATYEKYSFNTAKIVAHSYPTPAQPDAEKKQNQYFTFCTDIYSEDSETEICYGIAGNAINASTNYGGNLKDGTNIKSFGSGTITNFVKRIGDTLLVGVEKSAGGGELWLSDGLTTEANWTKVLETAVETGVHFSMYFGQSFYKNICLVAEYGSRNKNRNLYMSLDSGSTWSTILTIPSDSLTGSHIHDVEYDPYGGIIWVTTGDGIAAQNIYWSTDLGKTWKKMWSESGKCPAQFTAIMPLPNCILFSTDTTQNMSVYRINRVDIKDDDVPPIECAFVRFAEYNAESPFGTKAAIDYKNGAVYFGFQERYDVTKTMPTIYGTNNGHDFYVMWQDKKFPHQVSGSTVYSGINRMCGVSENGTVVAIVRNNSDNTKNSVQTLHFTIPTWKTE